MAQIVEDYESGMKVSDLVEKYGISKPVLYERLREEGVEIGDRKRGAKWRDLPTEQIVGEYESGMTLQELGKWYGVSVKTIRSRLKEAGVQIRNRGMKVGSELKDNKDRDSRIKERYQRGLSMATVGEEFGISRERVRQILKKQKVETRGNGWRNHKQQENRG
jgi:uncharacterized protein (DUF433 family)